jgi:hypothetical protein
MGVPNWARQGDVLPGSLEFVLAHDSGERMPGFCLNQEPLPTTREVLRSDHVARSETAIIHLAHLIANGAPIPRSVARKRSFHLTG